MNNKRIGGKNVAVRYAKHIEQEDDKSSSKKLKTPSAGVSSQVLADKKSKIQLIEEQLKRYQNASDDFELNNGNDQNGSTAEPLIKKYQYNKDVAPSTSGRYQSYHHKRKRKPY